MTELLYSPKITPEHLARKAIVYLRQSTDKQVRQNLESQRLQYDMGDRMRALGWTNVEIINHDLGASAAIAATRREGFERVLSAVALGEVGIVVSREVSRLSRTDKDWCRLVEVCQIFGTLIGDEQQVYDVNQLDDQLVLGIKGTLSVVELKVLRQRLQAGQESKARRGELFKRLPVGYARDALGHVVLHPDQRLRDAVHLVFAKFRQLWSVRQSFQWFRDHDIELPVNPIRGTQVIWKVPSQSLIRDVLRNPFYAGAYVWGRRPIETVMVDGRLAKRQGAPRRATDCRVFLPDHHPGYVDWATFEENQRMIRRNAVNWPGDESMPAIRGGQGLLAGLLRCGHCGRKLHVRYWGARGTHARYLCKGTYDDGGQYCIGFGGASVDRRVGDALLEVISPLGLDASLRAIAELTTGEAAQRTALANQLAQCAYEAQKAFEQYNTVDARNRLAAAELERRWNEKLEACEAVRTRLSRLEGTRSVLFVGGSRQHPRDGCAVCRRVAQRPLSSLPEEDDPAHDDRGADRAPRCGQHHAPVHHPLEGRCAHAARHGAASFRDRHRHTAGGGGDHSSDGGPSWRRPDCLGVEPTRIEHRQGETVESESRGHGPPCPLDRGPTTRAARS